MTWKFGNYTLDKQRAELIGPNGVVHVEPRPLDVLIFLIENSERIVTADELVDGVWAGRIVSNSTISTAVKFARKAVGDTGTGQSIIKTVRGRGFRFVADYETENFEPASEKISIEGISDDAPSVEPIGRGRPSLAVLRFQQLGGDESNAALSDAFTAELITSLSRMRWLHVISRGSSFRFDPKNSDPQDIGIQLGVRYLITGAIEIVGASLTISIDIQSTEDGTLIWSDRFVTNISEFHQTREEIAASAIAILELTVPQFEANHSRSLDTTQLDAWSHFHMGLTHIYRFNQSDNRVAVKHFNEALKLDPQFARAHAGLSFTHWQNAFMQFRNDRSDLVNMAIDSASRALEIDPIDPFANFNMGRARWIEGDVDGSKIWLDRALQINPNYAQCHYNKGVILTLSGAVDESQSSTHKAMSLSPLDPLYYAMLSVRAMSHITKDEFDIASELSERAMQSPGAHFYIALIAASSHELNGDVTAGQKWLNHALRIRPDVTAAMFLSAFPFQHGEMRKKMTGALHRLGLK